MLRFLFFRRPVRECRKYHNSGQNLRNLLNAISRWRDFIPHRPWGIDTVEFGTRNQVYIRVVVKKIEYFLMNRT